mmetsp:Transcript_38322/g.88622  ORF Transcript_38322/g.88622 Transcript_38322/m.88622 type:complete len:226 (-) Transcript_38322:261-938(-)
MSSKISELLAQISSHNLTKCISKDCDAGNVDINIQMLESEVLDQATERFRLAQAGDHLAKSSDKFARHQSSPTAEKVLKTWCCRKDCGKDCLSSQFRLPVNVQEALPTLLDFLDLCLQEGQGLQGVSHHLVWVNLEPLIITAERLERRACESHAILVILFNFFSWFNHAEPSARCILNVCHHSLNAAIILVAFQEASNGLNQSILTAQSLLVNRCQQDLFKARSC